MKKNVLFFTSLKANDPALSSYQEWCFKTWTYYAKKYDCEIFILEEPLYDTQWMRPTWQRWFVHELLEANNIEYNQIALIDIDTMVRWDTPNIFELSENRYTGVGDDISVEWNCNSITGYKKFFPNVDLRWDSYINNGMIVLPSDSKEFCKKITDFYLANAEELVQMQEHTLQKGTDQTPVNYMALEYYGDKIKYLPKRYNMTHLKTSLALAPCIETKLPVFIKYGYIWHFNAIHPRTDRDVLMSQTWEIIKNNYE